MRIGIQYVLPHSSPEEWAEETANMGFRAAVFPIDYTAPVSLIDNYVKAAEASDILIAEVGVWASPFSTDKKEAAAAREACLESFRLADYIGARCCVNVSGAFGRKWYSCYPENFTKKTPSIVTIGQNVQQRGEKSTTFAPDLKTMNDKQANIIQLIIAAIVVLSGVALLFVGIKYDPAGEIHDTVLVAFGEAATFAGSIIGIDYRYKNKNREQ